MSEEICSANPNDTRCSCYNIINRDCDANPDIPGCKESNAWRDSLVDAIPDKEEFKGQKDIAVREYNQGITVVTEHAVMINIYLLNIMISSTWVGATFN